MPDSMPALPGHRFAYDLDGSYTTITPLNGGTFTLLDSTVMNDEDEDSHQIHPYRQRGWRDIAIAFPEPRDVLGYFIRIVTNENASGNNRIFTSLDTTDGSNGTWVNQQAYNQTTVREPNYRSAIQPCSFLGIKGIRFRIAEYNDYVTLNLYNLHLYGFISPTVNPDRLEWWDPVQNQIAPADAFNFGDVAQGEVHLRPVRLRNMSPTKTATGVILSANQGAGGATGLASAIEFSTDGTNFATTLDIGDLPPDTTTDVITVRRIVGAAEGASLRAARILATPTTYA